jgi:hypothetical protein
VNRESQLVAADRVRHDGGSNRGGIREYGRAPCRPTREGPPVVERVPIRVRGATAVEDDEGAGRDLLVVPAAAIGVALCSRSASLPGEAECAEGGRETAPSAGAAPPARGGSPSPGEPLRNRAREEQAEVAAASPSARSVMPAVTDEKPDASAAEAEAR